MTARDDEEPAVVRLFPDYVSSALWFGPVHYPVDYGDTRISPELLARLERWEQSYYDGLDSDLQWRRPGLEAEFAAEGRKLARLLATELGAEFAIQLVTDREETSRSTAPASNPAAANAFRAFRHDNRQWEREYQHRMKQLRESGTGFHWTAYAPLSDTEMRQLPDPE